MRALIIDDSRFTRMVIKQVLKAEIPDINILEASSGKEGIEVFQKENPDLVLSDLLMPDIHGSKVVSLIRAENKNCFIAVLSSDIQQSTQKDLLERGANLFIGKPLTKDKVKTLLSSYQEAQ